jgi:two-component system OmpR family sensor kinase
LGLAIVQAVVQAHGGEVTVRSVPGDTVFTVTLPLEATGSDPAAPSDADESVAPPTVSRPE